MKVRIEKGTARGTVSAPPSKSMAHRLLICAAMAEGVSRVKGISNCEDVLATLDCLSALGIKTEREGNDVTVWGKNFKDAYPEAPLQCRESGSTLRFMIPAAMLSGKTAVFYGAGRLRTLCIFPSIFKGEHIKHKKSVAITYLRSSKNIHISFERP